MAAKQLFNNEQLQPTIDKRESEINIDEIQKRFTEIPALQAAIGEADVLIVPRWIEFNYDGWAFPQGTEGFYKKLKQEADANNIKIEIASTDEDYKELAQYHDWFTLPILFLVSPDVRSFIINLLSSYVYDRIKSRSNSRPLAVRSQLIYKDIDGKTIEWMYEGSANEYIQALQRLISETNMLERSDTEGFSNRESNE